jgi:hypothetical protein
MQSPVFRANAYIAEPMGDAVRPGDQIMLPEGWGAPEVTHRWTVAECCRIPLPDRLRATSNLSVTVANYLPTPKTVTIESGDARRTRILQPGQTEDIDIGTTSASHVSIRTSLTAAPNEPRHLGIAVLECRIQPA